jgi:hypothetical protein
MTDSTLKTEHPFITMNDMFDDYNEYQLRSLTHTDMELDALLEEQWPVEEVPQELLREF